MCCEGTVATIAAGASAKPNRGAVSCAVTDSARKVFSWGWGSPVLPEVNTTAAGRSPVTVGTSRAGGSEGNAGSTGQVSILS